MLTGVNFRDLGDRLEKLKQCCNAGKWYLKLNLQRFFLFFAIEIALKQLQQ